MIRVYERPGRPWAHRKRQPPTRSCCTARSSFAGHEHHDLVTRVEHGVATRHDQAVLAHHGDDGGVPGQAEVRARRADKARDPRRASPSTQVGVAALQVAAAGARWSPTTQPLPPAAEQLRGGHRDVDAPRLRWKSHWLLGWLTRAMTRGTANSCLANSEMTRLSSSSPVAATATVDLRHARRPSSRIHFAGVRSHPG